mmetsp:Transcript_51542/g.130291  ORF Transcript_51542/g.130291 Transcript_51542/m.130291 type:complete len:201 (-) Transcript_51542:640-1242(-)
MCVQPHHRALRQGAPRLEAAQALVARGDVLQTRRVDARLKSLDLREHAGEVPQVLLVLGDVLPLGPLLPQHACGLGRLCGRPDLEIFQVPLQLLQLLIPVVDGIHLLAHLRDTLVHGPRHVALHGADLGQQRHAVEAVALHSVLHLLVHGLLLCHPSVGLGAPIWNLALKLAVLLVHVVVGSGAQICRRDTALDDLHPVQ